MATSSITHNFVITGADAEAFAKAVEASFHDDVPEQPVLGRLVTDPEEAWAILKRCVERRRRGGADG